MFQVMVDRCCGACWSHSWAPSAHLVSQYQPSFSPGGGGQLGDRTKCWTQSGDAVSPSGRWPASSLPCAWAGPTPETPVGKKQPGQVREGKAYWGVPP